MAFKGDDSKFSIATTVTLALAVAALVLLKQPLKSSRPPGAGTEMNGIADELKARARLWEDPFAAVIKDLESRRKSGIMMTGEGRLSQETDASSRKQSEKVRMTVKTTAGSVSPDGLVELTGAIAKRLEAGERITALLVMTKGGPYANDIESRLEDRYALEAALDVGCFVPESTEFLRYFTWQFEEEIVATPYEWYSRNRIAQCGNAKQKDHGVLVLWVKADDYKGRMLKGLSDLIQQVPLSGHQRERIVFKIIGPRTSSEFEGLLQEMEERQRLKDQSPFIWSSTRQPLEVYSPWATAMPGLLAYGMKGNTEANCDSYHACQEVFAYLLAQSDLRVRYQINSDMMLFQELFGELDRREVTIGEDSIVLIGEWDSFYSRALPITFSAAACHYIADPAIPKLHPASEAVTQLLTGKCTIPEDGVNALLKGAVSPEDLHITRYSYLSGLDGESLEDQQNRSKAKGEDKEKESGIGGRLKPRDLALYEKPEGTSQLDYVRRLVSRIKSEERNQAQSHYRNVKAIGILGRDPYDTLLILQAMRDQFPTVLFFAVDLYARHFHDSEEKWARNLLIVSHFGLQLEPNLQQRTPPFRNSYQTSMFLAVLKSIDHIELGRYNEKISPRLFEIGRHGAVDLSIERGSGSGASVHPPRDDVERGLKMAKLPPGLWRLWIVAVVFVGVMLWCYARFWNWLRASEDVDPAARAWMRWLRAALVIVAVLTFLGLWNGVQVFDYEEDEPFSWTDGVSIWPTELLRLVAGLLAVWFMIKARMDLTDNTSELTSRFFPSGADLRPVTRHGFWSNVDWLVHGSQDTGPIPAADLWMRYCEAHGWRQRAGRVLLLFALYVVLIGTIWPLLNQAEGSLFVPCRGVVSCAVDRVAVAFSVLTLLALNLSVLDAVLLAARWTSELQRATGLNAISTARLIGDRTRIVNRRIVYPFIVLFLVIGARSHYFDNWDFPPALLVVLAAHSLVALASAVILYKAAINTRRHVIDALEARARPLGAQGLGPGYRSDRVRKMVDEVGSIQQGAFVPLYQQPVVQATLVAVLAFLQYWVLGQ